MTTTYNENSPIMERVLYEVKKVIVGQDHLLERVLIAVLSHGHLLVEGVPGLAKTLTIKTLADVMSGEFKRIQFTPDLVPAIWLARASTIRRRASSIRLWVPSSPTCSLPMKLTAPPPKCKARCSK